MGGCANSKYAVDEDTHAKKEKKPFLKRKSKKEAVAAVHSDVKPEAAEPEHKEQSAEPAEPKEVKEEAKEAKEDIDFIDREEAEKAGAAADPDEAKKEVTTYQTTVVKHTQKEGDQLLQYLKDEAFKSLHSSLTNTSQNRSQTTTASSSLNQTPDTATDDPSQDLLQQIKHQVLNSLGQSNEQVINAVLDAGARLIKDGQVSDMGQLEQALEAQFKDQAHMIAKVINSTTGFLTAKGTEAGAMLSTILANADSGIQGVMNETEKTTVKVTRTVTEQVLSGGQLTQITKIVNADGSQAPPAFQDFINNIAADSKQVKTGTTLTTTTTTVDQTSHTVNEQEESEKREDEKRESISSQAEQVVNRVINAAVEIVNQDEAGGDGDEKEEEKESETNVEIEEQSTVTTSTTKIVLNGDHALDQVQSEFFKQGKQSAQEVVSKLNMNDQVEIASN